MKRSVGLTTLFSFLAVIDGFRNQSLTKAIVPVAQAQSISDNPKLYWLCRISGGGNFRLSNH